jgi:uncharacterized damage-inducible protein DinB
MKDYFYKLFKFNHWANSMITQFLVQKQIRNEKILNIMSHLVHAQNNWYKRVLGVQQDVPVWNPLPLEDIGAQLEAIDLQWLSLVNEMSETRISENLAYLNMVGDPYLNTVEDILAHLVNHSTYHRGQVIYLIREAGIDPPGTDYIKFVRI